MPQVASINMHGVQISAFTGSETRNIPASLTLARCCSVLKISMARSRLLRTAISRLIDKGCRWAQKTKFLWKRNTYVLQARRLTMLFLCPESARLCLQIPKSQHEEHPSQVLVPRKKRSSKILTRHLKNSQPNLLRSAVRIPTILWNARSSGDWRTCQQIFQPTLLP